MSKSKKPDRHKPARMVRLPEPLARLLDEVAKENFTNTTQEAVRAVREMLQREGKLPVSSTRPEKPTR